MSREQIRRKPINMGCTRGPIPPDVFFESIRYRSIKTTKALEPTATKETPTTYTSADKATGPEYVSVVDPTVDGEVDDAIAEQESPPLTVQRGQDLSSII